VRNVVNYGKLTIKFENPTLKFVAKNFYNAGELNAKDGEITANSSIPSPMKILQKNS